MKFKLAARSAKSARLDVAGWNAGVHQLTPVAFHQVDFGTVVQIGTLWKDRRKTDRHLRAHFEAARSDSGTDGSPNVLRPCAKLTHHGPNGLR